MCQACHSLVTCLRSAQDFNMFLQSLDTAVPTLSLSDGSLLQGKYSETVGSFVFFDQPKLTQTSASSTGQSQDKAQYICCTEKQLTMRPAAMH